MNDVTEVMDRLEILAKSLGVTIENLYGKMLEEAVISNGCLALGCLVLTIGLVGFSIFLFRRGKDIDEHTGHYSDLVLLDGLSSTEDMFKNMKQLFRLKD